jgi:hypothetical protein
MLGGFCFEFSYIDSFSNSFGDFSPTEPLKFAAQGSFRSVLVRHLIQFEGTPPATCAAKLILLSSCLPPHSCHTDQAIPTVPEHPYVLIMVTQKQNLADKADELFNKAVTQLRMIEGGKFVREQANKILADSNGEPLASDFRLTIAFSNLQVNESSLTFRQVHRIKQTAAPVDNPAAVRIAHRMYSFQVVLEKRVTTGALAGHYLLTSCSKNLGKASMVLLADITFDADGLMQLSMKDPLYSEVFLQFSEPRTLRESGLLTFATDSRTAMHDVLDEFLDPVTFEVTSTSTIHQQMLRVE